QTPGATAGDGTPRRVGGGPMAAGPVRRVPPVPFWLFLRDPAGTWPFPCSGWRPPPANCCVHRDAENVRAPRRHFLRSGAALPCFRYVSSKVRAHFREAASLLGQNELGPAIPRPPLE